MVIIIIYLIFIYIYIYNSNFKTIIIKYYLFNNGSQKIYWTAYISLIMVKHTKSFFPIRFPMSITQIQ